MKKFILFAFIASLTLSAYSAPKNVDYVVTDDGITYFTKVRHGFDNFLIGKTEDGTKIKFKSEDIISYRKSGEVNDKKIMVVNGNPCENCMFLKLMKTKNGCGLYMEETYEDGQQIMRFYVYNKDNFVLEVKYDNYLQMFDFFDI